VLHERPNAARRHVGLPRSEAAVVPGILAYRNRSGYNQSVFTLTDVVATRRRDYRLGEYGSPAAM